MSVYYLSAVGVRLARARSYEKILADASRLVPVVGVPMEIQKWSKGQMVQVWEYPPPVKLDQRRSKLIVGGLPAPETPEQKTPLRLPGNSTAEEEKP